MKLRQPLLLGLGLVGALQAQVHFYTDRNFQGRTTRCEAGSYTTLGSGVAGQVPLIRVPPDYWIEAYDSPFPKGRSQSFAASQARLPRRKGLRTTSPGVSPYCVRCSARARYSISGVDFCDSPRFAGLTARWPDVSQGTIGALNRRISSIQIPTGL